MIGALKLRARIAAGRFYAATFGVIGAALRRVIPHDSWLGRGKQRLGAVLRPVPKRKLGFLLRAFDRAHPDARFVQIGANDGVLEDPLREFVAAGGWRGVLVEPVPYLFARLRETYRGVAGAILENVAIAARSGAMPFYYLRDSGEAALPEWHAGLGSFSREVVLKHADRIPDLERHLVTETVPCLTFAELCARHGIEQVDLLHMDTEGYDYEILKTIDFERWRPRLLVYEHHHLSAADREACLARLQGYGYEALPEGLDVICLNTRDLTPAEAPLVQAWNVLRRSRRIEA